MPSYPAEHQALRNRRPAAVDERPPVPPKQKSSPTLPTKCSLSLSRRRGLRIPELPKQMKPLPPVPQSHAEEDVVWPGLKPLPRPPAKLHIGTTALWVAGFVVWFLLVVVMLPVIVEREAMISMNAWLRRWR